MNDVPRNVLVAEVGSAGVAPCSDSRINDFDSGTTFVNFSKRTYRESREKLQKYRFC